MYTEAAVRNRPLGERREHASRNVFLLVSIASIHACLDPRTVDYRMYSGTIVTELPLPPPPPIPTHRIPTVS